MNDDAQVTAQRGDVVIFRVDRGMGYEELQRIIDRLEVLAGKTGVEFMVVTDEVEVHVARGDGRTEAAA